MQSSSELGEKLLFAIARLWKIMMITELFVEARNIFVREKNAHK